MLNKYVINVFFLSIEHFTRIVLNILVLSLLAKSLGPSDFGELNFIKGIVLAFSVLAKFGIEHVAMKFFLDNRYTRDTVLSTALFISIISAISAYIIVSAFSLVLNENIDKRIQIYALVYIAEIFLIIEYYYASQINSKVLVRIKVVFITITSLFKIWLLKYYDELVILDILLVDLLYSFVISSLYLFKIGKFNFKVDFHLMKTMVFQSVPLLFSSMAIIVFTKTDQIMIGKMLGMYDNGLYSAPVSIVFATFILPSIISNTIYPKLISGNKVGDGSLNKNTVLQFEVLNLLSFIIIAGTFFSSDMIVTFVFGSDFIESALVLEILIISLLFTSLGIGSNKWLLAKNLESIIFYRTAFSAIVNLLLNFLLIPIFGIVGAAFSSLMSMMLSGLFMNAMFKSSRTLFLLQIKSFLFVESTIFIRGYYVRHFKN